jgi:hypothetical protein
MIITLNIHPSWLGHSVLTRIHALEEPRDAGDDLDDLGALLDGIDAEPEPAALPTGTPPAAPPRTPAATWDGMTPRTGRELYKVACDRKALPAINRIGKAHGWPKLVTDWSPEQAAAAYRELTDGPAALAAPK